MRKWLERLGQAPTAADLRWIEVSRMALLASTPIVVVLVAMNYRWTTAAVLSACWTVLAITFYRSPLWHQQDRDDRD